MTMLAAMWNQLISVLIPKRRPSACFGQSNCWYDQYSYKLYLVRFTAGGNFVNLEISDDGGTTWTVPTTTVSGNVGSGQSAGVKLSLAAGTDFSGQAKSNMKVKVQARDYYGNQGSYSQSTNFGLDTVGPTVNSVAAVRAQVLLWLPLIIIYRTLLQ